MLHKILWVLLFIAVYWSGYFLGSYVGRRRQKKIQVTELGSVDLFDAAEWSGDGATASYEEETANSFEVLDICGQECLWIDDDRILISEDGFPCTITLPDGERIDCSDGYLYWLRGRDDDPEEIGSIESKKCVVNGLGRVIAKDPFIDVDADGYLDLSEEDVEYLGIRTGIQSFLKWW